MIQLYIINMDISLFSTVQPIIKQLGVNCYTGFYINGEQCLMIEFNNKPGQMHNSHRLTLDDWYHLGKDWDNNITKE